jgi:hypothetical protein
VLKKFQVIRNFSCSHNFFQQMTLSELYMINLVKFIMIKMYVLLQVKVSCIAFQ